MNEIKRIQELAGLKVLTEKYDPKIEEMGGDAPDMCADDIGRIMKLAGLRKKMENDKEKGKVDFNGIFTGVAKGDIPVNEELSFMKELEEGKKRDVDGDGDIDDDDWKAARDKAIKKSMKKESDESADDADELEEGKKRDVDGDGDIDSDDYMAAKDKAIKKAMKKESDEGKVEHTSEDDILDEAIEKEYFAKPEIFPKESLSRAMVEMIVDEMKNGKTAQEISEELSFDFEDVNDIFEVVTELKDK